MASISARWTGTGFTVHDVAGQVLCEASAGAWGLSRTWRVTGSDGQLMMTMTKALLRKSAVVHLANGEDFVLRGSAWKRDFAVTDRAGRTVLQAVPRTGALALRPHDYRVEQTGQVLSLPEFVALVQIWRMNQNGEAASAAAGGAAVAGT